jgi:hypothetical protein
MKQKTAEFRPGSTAQVAEHKHKALSLNPITAKNHLKKKKFLYLKKLTSGRERKMH